MHNLIDKDILWIKFLLEESTLTEKHIADMFGISIDVVSKIRQGKK